jgi:hypothetical protein
VFSNMYLSLFQYQEPHCYLCRQHDNNFHGLTFTMNAPEDLCVRCLIRIAKETHKLYNDNNCLKSRTRYLENLIRSNGSFTKEYKKHIFFFFLQFLVYLNFF